MSKWLLFKELEPKPKTKVIAVMSKEHPAFYRLGIIKWYPRWRQYAFSPENGTLFNIECMNDIIIYIKGLR